MTAKKLRTSMYRVIFVTVLTNKSQAHGLTITDLYAENIVFDTDTDDTHDSCIFDQLIANVCPVFVRCVVIRTENFEQPKNDSIASESPETSRLHYTAILVFVFFCFSAKFCMKSEEYFPDRLILL